MCESCDSCRDDIADILERIDGVGPIVTRDFYIQKALTIMVRCSQWNHEIE